MEYWNVKVTLVMELSNYKQLIVPEPNSFDFQFSKHAHRYADKVIKSQETNKKVMDLVNSCILFSQV